MRLAKTLVLYFDINPPSVGRSSSTVVTRYEGVDESLLNVGFAAVFPLLDLVPEIVPAARIERAKLGAAFARELLHGAKAPFELGVGQAQRLFRIDAEMTRPVRHREQQVADLFGLLLRRRLADFAQFFLYLLAHTGGVGPVEAHAPGAFAELGGPRQRG